MPRAGRTADDVGMSTDTTPPPQQQRPGYPPLTELRRSRTDRKIAGVAGGLGRYAGIDPLVFRILFVVLAVFGGSGILLYALAWLLIPEDGATESEGQRLFNGRSRGSSAGVIALVVVFVIGLAATGAQINSGPGIGGLGVLVVVAVIVVLLLRDGRRTPPAGPPVATGAATPPAEPGAYGQTPGTAYTSASPGTVAPLTQTASFAPPPGGPGSPAYVPAPPPPAPPRERSVLGRATLCVALIVVGLLVGWNVATDHDVPARVVIAAALGVVGAGLVVGAFVGRARWLVVWGVLLTLLASAASFSDVPVGGGIGNRTWTPRTVEQLHSTYRLAVGDAELDLSRLDLTGAGRQRVEIRQGVGDMTVVIPDDVVVRVEGDVNAGELRLPGLAPTDGTDLADRVVVPEGSSPSAAVLVVDAHLGVGSLEVRRAAS